ncbi:hypothetical protein CC1G_05120 [Coprinopsis cinerea okayama7|uniref:Piwi domain-containing protein n=1 Tax=Coprinopsis cinerea (strain Okayama-7 / 130 / ATCC MYA-4618 / FGSC 9003) TaxID=240176 RepID=A8NFX5_COPC7|nr:hypothetical protein CC1G_05120 [Coprinopsis cinerea okayama7\|eukprot:XP_001833420.2 hypothetical protein CC1G_05120 [Coprinopsis cinerea okayama7\
MSRETFTEVKVITNSFPLLKLPSVAYAQYRDFNPDFNEGKNFVKKREYVHHLQTKVANDIFGRHYFLYDGRELGYAEPELQKILGPAKTFYADLRSTRLFSPTEFIPPTGKGKLKTKTPCVEIKFTRTSGPLIGYQEISYVMGNLRNPEAKERRENVTNFLQLILRHNTNNTYPNNGKTYFPYTVRDVEEDDNNRRRMRLPRDSIRDAERIPSSGLELRRGLFHSIRPTFDRMIVTVDTSVAIFIPGGPLQDVIGTFLDQHNLRSLREGTPQFRKMVQYFKNVKIRVKVPEKNSEVTKTIRNFVSSGGHFMFEGPDGEMSVAEHYLRTHNYRVRVPQAPGVVIRENPVKVVVPMELCELVENQMFRRKRPEETAHMVRFSIIRPQDRLKKIKQAARNYDAYEALVQAGMEIGRDPLTVDGKLLTVPTLVYGNGDRMASLSSSIELGMNAKPPLVQRSLVDSASTQGDLVALVKECAAIAGRIHNINLLDDHLRRFMLVVILPEDALNLKAKVKYFGDITHGVPTQCLRVSKLLDPKSRRLKQPRQLNQYFNNVALKINARLRGVNVMLESKIPGGSPLAILSTQGRKTMIIGVDVSHPGPGVTNRPSVASLVFSLYQGGAQYAATTTIQKPRLEKVEQLASMFTYALNSYSAVMEGPPNTIVYYRDGVSEGEYTTIFEDEMAKLEGGDFAFVFLRDLAYAFSPAGFLEFKEQNKGKGPIPDKLQYTFIVVGKRHHTLLFPPTPDVADSTGNYIPGITVDTGVVQPFVPNFYLQSHSAIQGTSRSSHYIVLRNDTFPSLLEIERLSFELCHIYAKATRSVSIPAPVYYADLACGRGNFHFSPTIMGHGIDDSASFVSTGSDKYDDDYWKEVFRKVHVNLQPLMYFL